MKHQHVGAFQGLVLNLLTIKAIDARPLSMRATEPASRAGEQEEEQGGIARQAVGWADKYRYLLLILIR